MMLHGKSYGHMKNIILMLIMGLALFLLCAPSPSPTASSSPSSSPEGSATPSGSPQSSPASTSSSNILSSSSSGLDVMRLQLRLRNLNYLSFQATSSYGAMTRTAVIEFQQANELATDGTVGPQTLAYIYSPSAKRAVLKQGVKLNGPAASVSTPVGEKITWENVKSLLADGVTVTITDFNTGVQFNMVRSGGTGCAFMEAASNTDYNKLNDAFANGSWEKRAVIVEFNGTKYGASLSGAPYGVSSTRSQMPGHVELHFEDSTSDVLNQTDVDHQRMVKIACGD